MNTGWAHKRLLLKKNKLRVPLRTQTKTKTLISLKCLGCVLIILPRPLISNLSKRNTYFVRVNILICELETFSTFSEYLTEHRTLYALKEMHQQIMNSKH